MRVGMVQLGIGKRIEHKKAPEHSSGAEVARGDLGTWGLYSPKLKAVPHPKLLE